MRILLSIIILLVLIAGCDNGIRDELINGVDTNNVNDEQTASDDAVTNDDAVKQDDTVVPDDSITPDDTVVPDDNITPDDTVVPDENNNSGPVSMTVTVTTTTYGGQYAPRNVFAVWIEKADGSYVGTLGAWAQKYRSKLQRWYSKSGNGSQGMADAVTGASRMNHNNVPALKWTINDIASQPAADGIYNIYFELNETNFSSKSTTAQIKMGASPEIISVNNASNINNIQITFGN